MTSPVIYAIWNPKTNELLKNHDDKPRVFNIPDLAFSYIKCCATPEEKNDLIVVKLAIWDIVLPSVNENLHKDH